MISIPDSPAHGAIPKRFRPGGIGNWSGHLPFAYDLVSALQPQILVELGTHYGESYFAFCQAVDECSGSTRCYAVDTWSGDPQSGFYGEDVHQEVEAYNRANYSSFSELLRMTFDEAADQFGESTIDLLHIDGLHSFDAVAHDFNNWLPKVKPGGLILLHDIVTRHTGFGVWKLWEEISKVFSSFAFHHSYGLGAIRIPGPPVPENWLMQSLFGAVPVVQHRIRRYYVMLAEQMEYRMRIANGNCQAKERVMVKIYIAGHTGYDEHHTIGAVLPARQWQQLSFDITFDSPLGSIRIDPSDSPALIELAEIRVRGTDGRVIWEVSGQSGFDTLQTNNEVQVISRGEIWRYFCCGYDPQIILPDISELSTEKTFTVEICMSADTDLTALRPLLAHL